VIRSDASEAHRLSLSARVLSAQDDQVKAKQQQMKHFRGSPHATHQIRRRPRVNVCGSVCGTTPPQGIRHHFRYFITVKKHSVDSDVPGTPLPAVRQP
jgi:hypothetical protein